MHTVSTEGRCQAPALHLVVAPGKVDFAALRIPKRPADGEKFFEAVITLLAPQPIAVVLKFVRRMAADNVNVHAAVDEQRERVDLLHERGG